MVLNVSRIVWLQHLRLNSNDLLANIVPRGFRVDWVRLEIQRYPERLCCKRKDTNQALCQQHLACETCQLQSGQGHWDLFRTWGDDSLHQFKATIDLLRRLEVHWETLAIQGSQIWHQSVGFVYQQKRGLNVQAWVSTDIIRRLQLTERQ